MPILTNFQRGDTQVVQQAVFGQGDLIIAPMHGEDLVDNELWIIQAGEADQDRALVPDERGLNTDEMPPRPTIVLSFVSAADCMNMLRQLSQVYLSMSGGVPVSNAVENELSSEAELFNRAVAFIRSRPELEEDYKEQIINDPGKLAQVVQAVREYDVDRNPNVEFGFGQDLPRDDTSPEAPVLPQYTGTLEDIGFPCLKCGNGWMNLTLPPQGKSIAHICDNCGHLRTN